MAEDEDSDDPFEQVKRLQQESSVSKGNPSTGKQPEPTEIFLRPRAPQPQPSEIFVRPKTVEKSEKEV